MALIYTVCDRLSYQTTRHTRETPGHTPMALNYGTNCQENLISHQFSLSSFLSAEEGMEDDQA